MDQGLSVLRRDLPTLQTSKSSARTECRTCPSRMNQSTTCIHTSYCKTKGLLFLYNLYTHNLLKNKRFVSGIICIHISYCKTKGLLFHIICILISYCKTKGLLFLYNLYTYNLLKYKRFVFVFGIICIHISYCKTKCLFFLYNLYTHKLVRNKRFVF